MATGHTTLNGVVTYTGLVTSEAGEAIQLSRLGGLMGCVQALDGGGTGFNAGVLTIQHSNDGVNWTTMSDTAGTAITFTDGDEGEIKEFSTAARFARPLNDGTVGDVDVLFSFRS